jgi:hypothetical protein
MFMVWKKSHASQAINEMLLIVDILSTSAVAWQLKLRLKNELNFAVQHNLILVYPERRNILRKTTFFIFYIVRAFKPAHSHHNAQKIWLSPLILVRITGCVFVSQGYYLQCATFLPSHNAAATTEQLLLAIIFLTCNREAGLHMAWHGRVGFGSREEQECFP